MAIELSSQAQRTALILHGWNDKPNEGWLGWLSQQLRASGYVVLAPQLKTDQRPLLQRWSAQIQDQAQHLGDTSIIIAHSLGCFLTLRLLEELSLQTPVRKVILVSGFYDAPNEAASRFFAPEPNWQRIRKQATEFICVASSNDTIVTPDRTRRLAHKLGAELVMLADKGHFLGSRGMKKLPEVLDLVE